jgi:hypothetical protein
MLPQDQRRSRRVPIDCPARIRAVADGRVHDAMCRGLSTSGMTLHTDFVPRADEVIEVTLLPAAAGASRVQPMVARCRVRRCHAIEYGRCYELGVEILGVLS